MTRTTGAATSTQQRSRWRGGNYERRVAHLIGGKVVGRSKAIVVRQKAIELDPQHPPDVINSWCRVECKHFKELPVWLVDIMAQAVRNGTNPDLTPIAWIGDAGCKNNYVIIREKDWLDLHGKDKEA